MMNMDQGIVIKDGSRLNEFMAKRFSFFKLGMV